MSGQPELLPCPFCGGKAHWPEPDVNILYIGCTDCGASTFGMDEENWNTRAPIFQPKPTDEALVEAAARANDDLDDLVERLNQGVPEFGLDENNRTVIYDVDEADEAMFEAAQAISTMRAHPDPRDAVIAELVGALQDVVDELYTPEQNCSCHISPPCSDCLEYDGLRRIISNSRAALAKAETLK
jgi:predicted  nucleic acid-binding Zn-ribbon protein